MTNYELTHFKKMVQVWKTKSLLFCLRYDPLIVFLRQKHITFIFIKTMSHDLLVQMAYFDPSGETQKKENFYKYSRGSHKRLYIFSIQNVYIRQKFSQRGKREMVRAWAPNSRARFQAYSGNSDSANRPGYEADNITVLQILTASEIKANKADIVIKNKQEKSCLLIDMSTPTEKNTSVHVTEKLSKNKDLEIEIETMWGMKATTIPVVTGALGLTKKGLEKYIQQIPGNSKIHELQKITLLGTSHILRKAPS